MGMRGKKMAEDDEDGFALSKRDGFVGMRGKKWGFWTPRSNQISFKENSLAKRWITLKFLTE